MALVEDPPLIRTVRVVDPEAQTIEVTWKGGSRVGKEDTVDLSEAIESRRHYYRLLLSRPALFEDVSVVDGGRAIAWFNASITMSAEVVESLVPKRRVTQQALLYDPADGGPSIISVQPASGGFGTIVTITGNGFINATQVLFGNTPAVFTIVSDNVITATVP